MPYISRADWEATKPRTADKVAIDGVSLHANAGFDSFGRPKAQPVKIDVVLSLSQPTSSAATADALDHSTVHYGELGKAIIAHVQRTAAEWQQPHDFVNGVAETVMTFAEVRSAVEAVDVGVCFCKASLAGGGGWSLALSLDAKQGGVCVEYSLKGFRMPILIGVNKHERAMKQVVVVDVGIDRLGPLVANECYQVEQILAKVSYYLISCCVKPAYVRITSAVQEQHNRHLMTPPNTLRNVLTRLTISPSDTRRIHLRNPRSPRRNHSRKHNQILHPSKRPSPRSSSHAQQSHSTNPRSSRRAHPRREAARHSTSGHGCRGDL